MKVLDYNLSRNEYYSDFYFVPLAIVGLMFVGFSIPMMMLGFFLWTLLEYIIHRFIFHRMPAHDEHHVDPEGFMGASSFITLGLFAAICGLLYLVIGPSAYGLMSGLMIGYYAYIYVHDATHHARNIRKNTMMYRLKRMHMLHHWDEGYNFGVITSFWDWVFRTKKNYL